MSTKPSKMTKRQAVQAGRRAVKEAETKKSSGSVSAPPPMPPPPADTCAPLPVSFAPTVTMRVGLSRPPIVCLCGSTRFSHAFKRANLEETLAGRIVLSIGCDTKSDTELEISQETKWALDRLHLEKIDLADEVLVLNVGGYIGNSTRNEIIHAVATGKRVRFLHPELVGKPKGGF